MPRRVTEGPDYELWSRADTWTLKEGCFLANGCEPGDDMDWWLRHYDNGIAKSNVGRLYHLARKRFGRDEELELNPADFLRWCVSKKVTIPDPLKAILTALPPQALSRGSKNKHGNTEVNAERRQQVLGAALACLAAWPEQVTVNGKVQTAKLVRLIDEKAPLFWPETRDIPLTQDVSEKLCREWINKPKPREVEKTVTKIKTRF